MKTEKSKFLKLVNLILGLFFTISGIVTVGDKHYIFSIWIISLGISFLADPLKLIISPKISPIIFKVFQYILGAIVIVSGVIVLLMEFDIFKVI